MKEALRQIVLWIAAALAVAICADASASDVFQYKDAGGKITFSNIPCAGQTPKPESLEASAYSTPFGEWLGQIQFKETSAKGAAAKAVAALTKLFLGWQMQSANHLRRCRATFQCRDGVL